MSSANSTDVIAKFIQKSSDALKIVPQGGEIQLSIAGDVLAATCAYLAEYVTHENITKEQSDTILQAVYNIPNCHEHIIRSGTTPTVKLLNYAVSNAKNRDRKPLLKKIFKIADQEGIQSGSLLRSLKWNDDEARSIHLSFACILATIEEKSASALFGKIMKKENSITAMFDQPPSVDVYERFISRFQQRNEYQDKIGKLEKLIHRLKRKDAPASPVKRPKRVKSKEGELDVNIKAGDGGGAQDEVDGDQEEVHGDQEDDGDQEEVDGGDGVRAQEKVDGDQEEVDGVRDQEKVDGDDGDQEEVDGDEDMDKKSREGKLFFEKSECCNEDEMNKIRNMHSQYDSDKIIMDTAEAGAVLDILLRNHYRITAGWNALKFYFKKNHKRMPTRGKFPKDITMQDIITYLKEKEYTKLESSTIRHYLAAGRLVILSHQHEFLYFSRHNGEVPSWDELRQHFYGLEKYYHHELDQHRGVPRFKHAGEGVERDE